jgi:hypothetical protein
MPHPLLLELVPPISSTVESGNPGMSALVSIMLDIRCQSWHITFAEKELMSMHRFLLMAHVCIKPVLFLSFRLSLSFRRSLCFRRSLSFRRSLCFRRALTLSVSLSQLSHFALSSDQFELKQSDPFRRVCFPPFGASDASGWSARNNTCLTNPLAALSSAGSPSPLLTIMG